MKWLARAFASAVVRRLAFVLVALVLGYAGIGKAQAQSTATEAFNQLQAIVANWKTSTCKAYHWSGSLENVNYTHNAGVRQIVVTADCFYTDNGQHSLLSTFNANRTYTTEGCAEGSEFVMAEGSDGTWTGGCEVPCEDRPDETGWAYDGDDGPNAGKVCNEGCEYQGSFDLQGQVAYFVTGNSCTVGPGTPAPTPDTDGDGVGDPDDAFPNDPGESGDNDGDGIGDNSDTDDDDADNGADGGTGDETDNQASGGGTCNIAPTCSGDAIQCNILYQAWKTRCAVEAQGGGEDGDGTGPGEGLGELDTGGDGKTVADVYGEFQTRVEGSPLIDAGSNFFGGCGGSGSCPAASWDASTWGISLNLGEFCSGVLASLLAAGGYVVLALAAFAAFRMAFL